MAWPLLIFSAPFPADTEEKAKKEAEEKARLAAEEKQKEMEAKQQAEEGAPDKAQSQVNGTHPNKSDNPRGKNSKAGKSSGEKQQNGEWTRAGEGLFLGCQWWDEWKLAVGCTYEDEDGLPNITETLEAEVSPLPIQQPPCSLGQAREGVSVNSGLSSGQKNLRGISSGNFLPRTSWTL